MQKQNVQVVTNSYEISRLPTARFSLFDAFAPDIERKSWRKRSELVHHLQVTVHPDLFSPQVLYDGGAVAYVHHTTEGKLGSVRTFRVRLRDTTVPPPDARNVTEIKFQRTQGDPITATEINELVAKGIDSPRKSSLLNFMQLIIRQGSNNMHPNNGKAYFVGDVKMVACALELRRGIFHSVRPAVGRVTIVVDTTAAAFYRKGLLIDSLAAFFNCSDVRGLSRIDKRQWDIAKKFFKGVIITERKGNPPRTGGRRKVLGFNMQGAEYTFENDDGMSISIKDHYIRVHNMRLNFPKLPGVVLRDKPKPEIVPMELCSIEPDQLFKKALPEAVTRDMVGFATVQPTRKIALLKGAATHYADSTAMREAGMIVNANPITVDACMISPPKLEFGRDVKIDVRDGKWNVVGRKFFRPAARVQWAVFNLIPTHLSAGDLPNQLRVLQTCANNLGIPMGNPIQIVAADPNQGPDNLLRALDRLHTDVKNMAPGGVIPPKEFFVLFILPEEAAGPRATVKFWGDVCNGIVTQCVRINKIKGFRDERSASQYWNNVALKINARLGGENSRVCGCSAMTYLKQRGAPMFVGADVGHPSPGVRKPSVASLVYNQDPYGITYTALTRLQDPRQEVIVDLHEMFTLALVDIMKIAMQPVSDIVFFRDGVSEGEYERIEQIEIEALDQAIDDVWEKHPKLKEMREKGKTVSKPKLTFIVVGKRHHTVLFPGSNNVNDGKGNCKAGVVVNSGITQPTITDFYLLSHAAIIGTSRSSHYIVLRNEVFGNDTQKVEELAYALCHAYAKATRSVSIPAPVYYADLVCGRDSFHFAPSVEEGLRGSDSASVASGGAQAPFDLGPWRDAFIARHERLQGNMYFL